MNEWISGRCPILLDVWGTKNRSSQPSTHFMPGKKPKTKPKALGPTGATRAVEELIAGVESWSLLVQLLAAHYQLTNLSSKKGLKESYRNIDTISVNLRYLF